jgi:GDP-L-fucose synthase
LAAKFVKAKASGQAEITIWGTGVAIREWLYAPDFARVVKEVIEKPDMLGLNEPLNVGQNFGVTVRELVDLVSRAVGYSGAIRFDPSMPDGAPRKVMDDRRFRKVFPNFEFTAIDAGLKRTIEYYGRIYPY